MGDWTDQDSLLVLDEVHKYKKWKTLLKGFYDTENEIHFLEDYEGYKMGLLYVKDKNQREVDFLDTQGGTPAELVEVKLTDETPAKNLISFAEILKVQHATQIVQNINKSWSKGLLRVQAPLDYFKKIETSFLG